MSSIVPATLPLLFVLSVWLAQAGLAGYAAHCAGRDILRWVLCAILLGPVALVTVLLLPPTPETLALRRLRVDECLVALRTKTEAAKRLKEAKEQLRREADHLRAAEVGAAELLEHERQRLAQRLHEKRR